ncbi:MAG: hypothetical protein O2901_12115 [Verrucomicrobia bacterium]|nr:hypothetical protein [Verrucomicrobiota bacterium]
MDINPAKALPPSPEKFRTWVGMLVLFFFGGAMYPQGIQRLYAAKSMRTLKRSLAVMVFLPLGLVLFTLMMGVLAIPQFPALDRIQSDKVMTLMLNARKKGSVFQFVNFF